MGETTIVRAEASRKAATEIVGDSRALFTKAASPSGKQNRRWRCEDAEFVPADAKRVFVLVDSKHTTVY
jgi:hypothetical protein